MGEPQDTIPYSPKELVAILIKDRDIHEGHWGIHIEFNFSAGMVPITAPNQSSIAVLPTALASVGKVGIHRFDNAAPFTVDASQVNPSASADKPQQKLEEEKKD